MTRLSITSDSSSKREVINTLLEKALERERRLLEIGLQRTQKYLQQFEKQYQMSSEKFFQLYQAGKTDDRNDYIDWAGEYRIYLSLSEKLQYLKELEIEHN